MSAIRSVGSFLAVVLFPVAVLFAAENRGVAAANGHTVTGQIDPAGDEDCFLVDLSEGGLLSMKIAAPKGGTLQPSTYLRRPDGTVVGLANFTKGSGTTKLSVKKAPIDITGKWAVCIGGLDGTTGTYSVKFTSKVPTKAKIKGGVVPSGASQDFEATGDDGSFLTFSVKEKEGPPVDGVEVLDPTGVEVPGAAALILRKGTKISGKNIPLGQGFGRYSVRVLSSGAGSSVVDVQVKVKFPKPEKLDRILGPEPRPETLSPPTGRDGTPVTLGGSGFVDGARVFFDQVEATGVAFVSSTQITCSSPFSAQSDAGAVVPVTVLNPDGQENTKNSAFLFLGLPVPSTIAPTGSPVTGGIQATITGSGFRTGSTVTVGGTAATNVSVQGSNQITCTLPAHAAGPVQVVVTDEFGRSSGPITGLTYFGPPTLSGASPTTTPSHGGRIVTLSGSGFRAGLQVLVGGILQTGVSIAGNGNSLTFTTVDSATGTFDVEVVDQFGQSASLAGILTRTRSFQARPASVPAAPAGGDFFGTSLTTGDLDGSSGVDLVVAGPQVRPDPNLGGSFPGSWLLFNAGSGAFNNLTAARHAAFSYAGDFGQADATLVGDLDGGAGDEILLTLSRPLTDPNYFFYRNGYYYAYYLYYNGYVPDYRSYNATRSLSNSGPGTFLNATSSRMPSSASSPYFGYGERYQGAATAMGDLDGDNDQDVVIAGSPAVFYSYSYVGYYTKGYYFLNQYKYYVPALRVMQNDASGVLSNAFAVPGPYYMNGAYYSYAAETFEGDAVAVGDLDGDSNPDIVVSRSSPRYSYYYNYSTNTPYYYYRPATRILTNNGYGTFFNFDAGRMPTPYGVANPYSYDYWQADNITLGDLDGDGMSEIILGRDSAAYWYDVGTSTVRLLPAIRILSNNGTGYFTEATGSFLANTSFKAGSTETILSATSIRLGDLDGDTEPDLVVTGNIYYIYDYAGSGFGYYGILPSGYVYATKVLLGDGSGSFGDVTGEWMPPPVNGDYFQGDANLLGDLDGDGDLDLVIGADFNPDSYYVTSGSNRPLRIFENR